MTRKLKYFEAIREATSQCMEADASVYVMGLGVPDPKGIFGTTLGLKEKFGSNRVMDMPCAENAMTGIAIGSAIVGMRPILTHQRIDFALLSIDQIINNAAKWHYMFNGQMKVPLVIRMVIGRGWGQGPQHSQSLHSLFAHIPGLKVVMPSSPYDAKGLLIAAVEDNNPVIYCEHRWLHNTFGPVPEEPFRLPIGKACVVREGRDLTLVASSHMVLESVRAARILSDFNIQAEVVDLRSLRPLDEETILNSVKKTGRLLVVDGGWPCFGVGSEILALVAEKAHGVLKTAAARISLPDHPSPTSWALANLYYPRFEDLVNKARILMGQKALSSEELLTDYKIPLDVPDKDFLGPF